MKSCDEEICCGDLSRVDVRRFIGTSVSRLSIYPTPTSRPTEFAETVLVFATPINARFGMYTGPPCQPMLPSQQRRTHCRCLSGRSASFCLAVVSLPVAVGAQSFCVDETVVTTTGKTRHVVDFKIRSIV